MRSIESGPWETCGPDFKVMVLLKVNISKMVRVMDKVSIEH